MKDKIQKICEKLNREQLSVHGATNELLQVFANEKRKLIRKMNRVGNTHDL